MLPAVAAAIWVLFAVLERTPSLYNLSVVPDHPRRDQVANVASEFIASLGILITWSFALMTWSVEAFARHARTFYPSMLLCTSLLLVGMLSLCAVCVIRMQRAAEA